MWKEIFNLDIVPIDKNKDYKKKLMEMKANDKVRKQSLKALPQISKMIIDSLNII